MMRTMLGDENSAKVDKHTNQLAMATSLSIETEAGERAEREREVREVREVREGSERWRWGVHPTTIIMA